MPAPKTVKVGPGQLTMGAVGSPKDWTGQVRSATVKWSKDAEDDMTVLTGDVVAGEVTYTATLDATFLQDLSDDGLVEWSWENKGTQVPFAYTPSTAAGKTISGTLTVDPLDVGGDVGTKVTSDVSWACVGVPIIGADLG